MDVEAAARLLEQPQDATVAEIHHAYLRLARSTHPDLLAAADDATRRAAGLRFAELRRARDVLLALHPVVRVDVEPRPAPAALRPVPSRGIGGSVVILLLLALLVVGLVSAQDAYRTGTVSGVFELPTSPPPRP